MVIDVPVGMRRVVAESSVVEYEDDDAAGSTVTETSISEEVDGTDGG